MGNTNSCIRHFKDALSSLVGGSTELSEHVTAPPARILERATTISSPLLTEEKIKRSMVHWSQPMEFNIDSNSKPEQVPELSSVEEEMEAEVSNEDVESAKAMKEEEEKAKRDNMEVFKALQAEWGNFFYTFSDGELEMENVFAAGTQAELYGAVVKWRNPNWRKELQREGVLVDPPEYVLKVFRKGTYLRHLKSNLPPALLDFHKKRVGEWMKRRYNCDVVCATLLEDGRFAFVLQREDEDLRDCIDRHMRSRTRQDNGPFPKEVAEQLMYEVAEGMNWLHEHNIIHRDLKASNVLVTEDNNQMCCFVTDYECSVGVEGTTFWRAPEILQAFKDARSVRDRAGKERCRNERQKLFTKEADVYSYGMTCYEILTGRIPFEGHSPYDFDLVLNGYVDNWARELLCLCCQFNRQPLEIPEYVDNWVRELLCSCWQFNPMDRPSFGEILNRLRDNSAATQGNIRECRNMAHSKVNWSQIKTQMFSPAELLLQVKLMRARAKQAGEVDMKIYRSELFESNFDNDEGVEVDNREVFKTLQSHPTWGAFFITFPEGEVLIWEKFAEGGQAELFHVQVNWQSQFHGMEVPKYLCECEWVIKVFKSGTSLRHLQLQMPQSMFQFHAERMETVESPTREWKKPRCVCDVLCGILLNDGRFGLILEKKEGDLRDLIDHKMRTDEFCGPFSKEVALGMMHNIAVGIDWLHSRNIVHRDLKASNVLISEDKDGNYQCFICDYECSIGVLGTGFWRAPEILQSLKDRTISQKPELFTKPVDIYGYGMICYEILTGLCPFEDLSPRDYDPIVIDKRRPKLPKYVDDWVCKLLNRCWEFDPEDRPLARDILKVLTFRKGTTSSEPLDSSDTRELVSHK